MTNVLIAQIGFIILTIICLVVIFIGLKKSTAHLEASVQKSILSKYVLFLSLWIISFSSLSITGFLSNFSTIPPRLGIILIVPISALILLFRSKHLDSILAHTPPKWLFNIQVFRIPVEIFLWLLFLGEVLPERMTFEGSNFDILAGITAPFFAYFCFSNGKINKKLALAWNIACLFLLANIVIIALLTFPTVFQVFTGEDNTIIPTFPIVLLPAILVPIAYFMHCLSIRQLLKG